jgi:hypothetical protein
MGRRSLLTPQLQQQLVELLAGGEHVVTACAEAGISPRTYDSWRARGRDALSRLEDDEQLTAAQEARQQLDERVSRRLKPTKTLERRAAPWDSWAERPYLLFLLATQRAEARPERAAVHDVLAIGRGGQLLERRVETHHRRDGTQVEIVTERYSQPQWLALMTWLERRQPSRWRRELVVMPSAQAEEDGQLHKLMQQLTAMREDRQRALAAGIAEED